MEQIEKVFRPEFLNRVDDVIVFRHLTSDDLKQVVELELGKVRERLGERGLKLVLTDEAKKFLIKKGSNTRLRRPAAASRDRELRRRSALRGTAQGRVPGQGHDRRRRQGSRRQEATDLRRHRSAKAEEAAGGASSGRRREAG